MNIGKGLDVRGGLGQRQRHRRRRTRTWWSVEVFFFVDQKRYPDRTLVDRFFPDIIVVANEREAPKFSPKPEVAIAAALSQVVPVMAGETEFDEGFSKIWLSIKDGEVPVARPRGDANPVPKPEPVPKTQPPTPSPDALPRKGGVLSKKARKAAVRAHSATAKAAAMPPFDGGLADSNDANDDVAARLKVGPPLHGNHVLVAASSLLSAAGPQAARDAAGLLRQAGGGGLFYFLSG